MKSKLQTSKSKINPKFQIPMTKIGSWGLGFGIWCLGFILSFGFCYLNLAHASEPNFKLPLHVKWVTKLKKGGFKKPYQFSSPTYNNGKIFVGSTAGEVYAIDARLGKKLWRVKTQGPVYSQPRVEGENIFVTDLKGTVYSITAGKINWYQELANEVTSTPLIVDDTLYVATNERQLVALDATTGAKKWQTFEEGALPDMTIKGSSNPIIYQDKIYVGYADGYLAAYDSKNGQALFKKNLSSPDETFLDVDTTPLIADDRLFIASVGGGIYSIDPKNGDIIWHVDKKTPNDISVSDGSLYVTGQGKITSLEAPTGRILWEKDLGEPEISAPAVSNGLVAVISTRDKLYIIDATSGEVRYKRHMRKGSFGRPVIINDKLYILTNSGRLFAISS